MVQRRTATTYESSGRQGPANRHPTGPARALLLALIWLALAPVCARAEFILTASSGVYQTDDGRTKVILSHKDGHQGIFVVHFKEGVAPQEFNPEAIPTTGVTHVFIRFNPNLEHQYSEIVIGPHSYKVNGNLNIWLTQNGSVSVNVDNMNPYLTVTQRDSNGRGDAIIGFYGLAEVVRGKGSLAAILAANQLSPDIAKILKPYLASPDGLQLNGKNVQTPAIGLFVSREHECSKDAAGVSILTLAQLKAIQQAKSEAQQAQSLDRFLKENQNKPPTKGHMVLRAEPNGPMILLDIATKNIFDMRAIKNNFSKNKICVVSPVQ